MPLLILFDPPFKRFLAVRKIDARRFRFLLQQVLRAQQAAFQRLFVAPLGLPVLAEKTLLNLDGALNGQTRLKGFERRTFRFQLIPRIVDNDVVMR